MRFLLSVLRALLPVLLLLLLAELGLWVAGVDAPALGDAGFSGARLIVADDHEPDVWHTQLFNGTRKEQRIEARDERCRVLLFGGSNTQYFPENLLDYMLETNDPNSTSAVGDAAASDLWEVINLGREGYGSQRVVRLVREAMVLQPDIVVIYSGHNEFVERIFEMEVQQQRGGVGAALVGALGWLRSARVLSAALRGEVSSNNTPVDESALLHAAGGADGPDQSGELLSTLSFSDTLHYREAYQTNLSLMVDAAQAAGAQVILCTVVRNMLVPPRVYRLPETLSESDALALKDLRQRALKALPARFSKPLRPYETLWVRSWFGGHDPSAGLTPAAQRSLLGDAAQAPAMYGPKTGSVTDAHWPDPAGWTPDVFALLATTSEVLARRSSEAERAALLRARVLLEEGLALSPNDALLRYDRGLVGWLLSEDDAVSRIDHSIDTDFGPRTTTPAQNALVRELATQRKLSLLDAAQLFRDRSPDGLVGFELLMDHCHLQPGARVILMHDMASALAALAQ